MPIETETGSKLTYEDYVQIPEDGKRHEIIEGAHVVSSTPGTSHQSVLVQLVYRFGTLADDQRAKVLCIPVDVLLSEFDIVQPDLVAVAADSSRIVKDPYIDGPPELVVEIHSPSTRRRDRGAKRALYEVAGVREYWMVDLEDRSLARLSLVDGRFEERLFREGIVDSTAFPGFSIELSEVF